MRSLTRVYGWFFLWQIVLLHPIKTVRGVSRYRKFFQGTNSSTNVAWTATIRTDGFIERAIRFPGATLIAAGFCQRPLKLPDQPDACPSTRFSHACWYRDSKGDHPACRICDIRRLVDAAHLSGTTFYIMTSALDIARDIFLPTIKYQKYQQVVFFICPYSIKPIILPLMICGIRFILIPYIAGDCQNYDDFAKADRGQKERQTFVKNEHVEQAINLLRSL